MSGLDLLIFAARVRDAAYSLIAGPGFARFGKGSRILLPFRVLNGSRIAIGRNVLIGAGSWLIVPADVAGSEPVLVIGDRVRMNQTSISAVSSVIIEEAAAFARGVYISDHSHGMDDPDLPIRDQPIARIAPVRIGRGAWLGQNVVVLPGVTIGAGSVIGANSVVRHDIPPRSVAVGSPARVIRQLPTT